MQDEDKLRERVQIMLDNRQIFLLFLASSVILALVFSLGLVVGKRLSTQAVAPAPSDPLAMLDKLSAGDDAEDNLTYHDTLTSAKPAPHALTTEPDLPLPAAPSVEPDARVQPPAGKTKKSVAAPEPDEEEPSEEPAVEKQKDRAEPKSPPTEEDKPTAPGAGPSPSGASGEYTLQLSAFQDRNEADLFIQSIKDSGYKPYIQTTTIPGRGVWYRVRMGSFKNWEDAVQAKQRFEARHPIIAYVTKK